MNAREQLLTEAARLFQVIIDQELWLQRAMRLEYLCAFCGQVGEFGGDKDTIVHSPRCELARIQGWLAAWEVERQRPGKPAWFVPPIEGTITPVSPEDIEVDE